MKDSKRRARQRARGNAKNFAMPSQDELRDRYDYRDGYLYHRHDWNIGLKGKRLNGWLQMGRSFTEVRNNGCAKKLPMNRLILAWHGVTVGVGEVVHHINGSCNDNRIENLVVWPAEFHEGYHGGRCKRPACASIHDELYRFRINTMIGYGDVMGEMLLSDQSRSPK